MNEKPTGNKLDLNMFSRIFENLKFGIRKSRFKGFIDLNQISDQLGNLKAHGFKIQLKLGNLKTFQLDSGIEIGDMMIDAI